jgi:hypothetical protein
MNDLTLNIPRRSREARQLTAALDWVNEIMRSPKPAVTTSLANSDSVSDDSHTWDAGSRELDNFFFSFLQLSLLASGFAGVVALLTA